MSSYAARTVAAKSRENKRNCMACIIFVLVEIEADELEMEWTAQDLGSNTRRDP